MKPIIFQILDWDSYHEEQEDDDENINIYKIRIFGRTKDDKTVYLEVNEYKPYFYIEINKAWRKTDVDRLLEHIKPMVYPKEYANGLVEYNIVENYKFNGFTNNTLYKFLELKFNDTFSLKAYERAFKKKRIYYWLSKDQMKFKIYDSSLDPLLRYMHDVEINPMGWVIIDKYQELNNIPTTCDINIMIYWKNIKHHTCDDINKLKIMSFDLECYSHDGKFPQAKRDGDEIIQIGVTMSRVGETECYDKHLLALKKTDSIDNVNVEYFETEKELLLAFTRIMHEKDPDIVMGYNIFGFDFPYMRDRAIKNKIDKEFARLSRVKDEICEFIERELKSAALGDNILKFYKMTGRVVIDLMKVVQKDYASLEQYKLDYISSYFIKGQIMKYRILDKEIEFVVKNVCELKIGDYVSIYFNDGIIDDKTDNKYVIKNIDKDNIYIDKTEKLLNILKELTDRHKIYWCANKDDMSPSELFKKYKEGSKERSLIGKYCIQDCALCNKLIDKLKIIVNNVGMANVCSVPLSYLFLRGQGIKIFSLIAKQCRREKYLIKTKDAKKNIEYDKKFEKFIDRINRDSDNSDTDEEGGYEGALVIEPKKGVYMTPIPVLDYASLYPNSMICKNISHESLVTDDKYLNLSDYIYHEVSYKNEDGTTTTCKFAEKKTGEKAILPKILMWLLSARKKYKNLMESCSDPQLKSIYNGMQLAYKVVANSVYGSTGASTSKIFKKEVAASTTAVGRDMLRFAKDFVENDYAKILENVHLEYDEYSKFMTELYKNIADNKFSKYKFNTKEEMFRNIYNELKELVKDYKTDPKIIYGDSVTGDTPILLKYKDKITIKTIDSIGSDWKEYIGNKEQDDKIDYKVWTDKGWADIKRIIRHRTNKQIYEVLTNNGYVTVTEDHSLLTTNIEQIKPCNCVIGTKLLHSFPIIKNGKNKIGIDRAYNYGLLLGDKQCEKLTVDILNGSEEEKRAFLYGYRVNNIYYKVHKKNGLNGLLLYTVMKSLGYDVTINISGEYLQLSISKLEDEKHKIKHIKKINKESEYVYDLETSIGHFHAGIGELIIKNTDSVFFSLNLMRDEKKLTDKRALEISIKCGQIASKLICGLLPTPMAMEYEKVLWPLLLLSKKRYVGNLYEEDPNKFYQKNMGIVLKRRDNAPIVKIVCGNIIDQILNKQSKRGAIEYTRNALNNIVNGKYNFSKFIITKTLRENYKDRSSIVHVALADRMAERDPGNKPQINDRIPYAYVETNKKIKLQGDRVEHPEYIINNNLKLDYLFYITNQIMKPAIQFLELVAENPQDLFNDYIIREQNKQKKMIPIEFYFEEQNKGIEKEDKIDLLNIEPLSNNFKKSKVKRKINIECMFKSSIE